MARSNYLKTRKLIARIRLDQSDYDFPLFARTLVLSPKTKVQYYWMNSPALRSMSPSGQSLFQTILGYWDHHSRLDESRSIEDEQHYVIAQCYPLVSKSKGMQSIYRDAFLAPGLLRDDTSIPDRDRRRIAKIVRSQSADEVRRELDNVLEHHVPASQNLPALRSKFVKWIDAGVAAKRSQCPRKLESFLRDIDTTVQRMRKKPKSPLDTEFLNLFSYECKSALHLCYASAWMGIIPWLREHEKLDETSERFLRLWHNYTPRNDASMPVFPGQVLSLHPLSSFFMSDSSALADAEKFITSGDYTMIDKRTNHESRKYWKVVGAILTAAHLYNTAAGQQRLDRKEVSWVPEESHASDAAVGSFSRLEDFLGDASRRCEMCGQLRAVANAKQSGRSQRNFKIFLFCKKCRESSETTITRKDFESWFKSD